MNILNIKRIVLKMFIPVILPCSRRTGGRGRIRRRDSEIKEKAEEKRMNKAMRLFNDLEELGSGTAPAPSRRCGGTSAVPEAVPGDESDSADDEFESNLHYALARTGRSSG